MHPWARCAIGILLLGSLTLAQDAPDPFFAERVLPDSTLLYFSLPQTAAISDDFSKSNLSKLLHHPEMQAFARPLEDWWKRARGQAGRELPFTDENLRRMVGVSLGELWETLQGPLSIALCDVPVGNPHKFDLVVTLGSPNVPKLEKALTSIKAGLLKQGGLKEEQFSHSGVSISELGDASTRVYYAMLQGTLVVTTVQERMEQIIDADRDKGWKGLREEASFKAARARVSPDNRHFLLFEADLSRILKLLGPQMGDEAQKILDTTGISDLGQVAVSLGYDGPYIRERYALMTRRHDRGLLRILAGHAAPDPYAALVPREAIAYSHMSYDLTELYDVIRELAKVNPDFERGLEETLGRFEKQNDLRLREAFATLGASWTSWSVFPEAGGVWPDSLTAVPVKDAAAFESAVEKSCKAGGFPIEALSFRGKTIKYITFGLDRLLDQVPSGLPDWFKLSTTLSYLIDENTLFFSGHPMALKRLILRKGAPGASIQEAPRYADLSQRAAGPRDAWLYIDVGRLAAMMYGFIEPFAHLARDWARDDTGELVVDLAQLPLEETVSELLGGSLAEKRSLEDGIVIESRSNTGATISSVIAYTAIVAAVAIPRFMVAREVTEPLATQGNEQLAQVTLQIIRSAEETFKNSDSDANGVADYWTRDVAGLHALKDRSGQAIFLLDPQTAAADPDGAGRYALAPAPKNGYFYKMMVSDPDGQVYQKDDGKTNKNRFGVVAYPAVAGVTGRFTYITDESGKIWKKDTGGKPVDRWPGKDPTKDGWALTQ